MVFFQFSKKIVDVCFRLKIKCFLKNAPGKSSSSLQLEENFHCRTKFIDSCSKFCKMSFLTLVFFLSFISFHISLHVFISFSILHRRKLESKLKKVGFL